ncbi:MAG: cytidine deaminase, partial [Synergistaceae bacterium]|nr:cytidine deaminase [Synergistaceae bacterium]
MRRVRNKAPEFIQETGGLLTPSNGSNYWSALGMTPERLIKAAEEYKTMAYAPYSNFFVGAALLMDDGFVVGGCNVENASYGVTLCAERIAMANAVSMGKINPLAIAIAGDVSSFCSPCGACRQFLAEFNPDMDVLLLKS